MSDAKVSDEMRERARKHFGLGAGTYVDSECRFAASESALAVEAYRAILAGPQAPELAEAEKSLRGAAETRGTREFHVARELDRLRLSNTSLEAQLADAEVGLAKIRELCGRAARWLGLYGYALRERGAQGVEADIELAPQLEAAAKGTP